jgi:hypothetical protein
MDISPIINLILLLAFTYFIASLLVTSVNEAIAGSFKLRQKQLRSGLTNLFFSQKEEWVRYIEGDFMKSPFIESLKKDALSFPAYIPARNFALAVLTHCGIDRNKLNTADVIEAINNAECLPSKMKDVVKGFLQQGVVNIPELEKNLEEFYNNAMDRVSGFYKRKIRLITFFIGLSLAVALNIDTIKIVGDGLSDRDRLERTGDAIAQQIASVNKDGAMNLIMGDDAVTIHTKTDPQLAIDSSLSFKSVTERLQREQAKGRSIVMTYKQTTGYKMGYPSMKAFRQEWLGSGTGFLSGLGLLLKKLLGVVLTAFALQLGSNYWFGVLNKVISIRAAGVKPDAKKEDR